MRKKSRSRLTKFFLVGIIVAGFIFVGTSITTDETEEGTGWKMDDGFGLILLTDDASRDFASDYACKVWGLCSSNNVASTTSSTTTTYTPSTTKTTTSPTVTSGFTSVSNSVASVVDCTASEKVEEHYIDGTSRVIMEKTAVFKPLEVQSTKATKDVSETKFVLRASCKHVKGSGQTYLDGGTATIKVTVSDENGVAKTVISDTVSIPSKRVSLEGNSIILAQWSLSSKTIQDAVKSSKPSFISWIRVDIDFTVNVRVDSTSNPVQKGAGKVASGHIVRVINDSPPSNSQGISGYVALRKIDPMIVKLGDNNANRINVIGEMEKWTPAEGLPYITIFKPNGQILLNKVTMTSYKQTGINVSEFTARSVFLGDDSIPTGSYRIEMHSNDDFRKTPTGGSRVSMLEFQVIKETIKPTPPILPTGGEDGTNNLLVPTRPYILYEINYEGGRTVDIIPKTSIEFTDFQTQLLGIDIGLGKRLFEIKIASLVDLTQIQAKNINVQNVNVRHTFSIYHNDELVVPNANFDAVKAGTLGTDKKYLTLSNARITPNEIVDQLTVAKCKGIRISECQEKLEEIGIKNGDRIKIEVKIDADYDLIMDQVRKPATVRGLTFTYNAEYSDAPIITPEPCEGLSDTESDRALLDCLMRNKLGVFADGEKCEHKSVDECFVLIDDEGIEQDNNSDDGGVDFDDYFKDILSYYECLISGTCDEDSSLEGKGNPEAKSGISGFCEEWMSFVQCASVLQELFGVNGTYNPDISNTLLVGGIIVVIVLLFIVMIAYLMRRNR